MAGLIMNQTIAPESVGTGFASPKIRKDRDSSFLAHGQRNQTPCFLHLVCFLVFYGLLFHSLTPVVTGRRATPSASEGIEDGAKVAIFSNFCDSFDVPVDALVIFAH